MLNLTALSDFVATISVESYQVKGKGSTLGERMYFLNDYFSTWW